VSADAAVWSHIALNCRDLAATEEFYTRWFGFRRSSDFDLGDTRIVFLRCGDAYLELFGQQPLPAALPAGEADGPQQPGALRHLAFQVPDVDALLAEMGGRAKVTLGPLDFDSFIPGWRSAWLLDPDGYVVEVSQGYRDPAEQGAAPA
jgi:glyoxylase I family protein